LVFRLSPATVRFLEALLALLPWDWYRKTLIYSTSLARYHLQ